MNFTRFPRRKYIQSPTPIEPMPALSRALGGDVNLFVKRDDLLPGAGGGNKTRKLEFCIADAMVEAVKLFAQTEAILLDPVYSGKTAAGLIGRGYHKTVHPPV